MFKKLLIKLTGRSGYAGVFPLGDPGMATHSIIRVAGVGDRHEHLVGLTTYGKGHEPVGGHKI